MSSLTSMLAASENYQSSIINHQLFGHLALADIIVLVAAIALLLLIAYLAGRREADTADFFLGKRRVPMLIACLSFVATEVSAVTLISVPAVGYSENWQYLQFFVGSAAARIFVAFLFIPVFYKYECTSIYEFLRHRFGSGTQYAGSIFFFITRLVGSGVRLYAACLAISFIMNWPLAVALVIFTAISIAFIGFGGIKAVVWSGAYVALTFYSVGIVLIAYLFTHIGSDFHHIWQVANDAGRLSVFNFKLNLNDPTTFWAGTANAFFIGLAVFGTDQELVQRLLTVDTRKTSQKAIISTIFASLPITIIYLSVGTLLFVFYKLNPAVGSVDEAKKVLLHFVADVLPFGLKGLILTAVVFASIDMPLASLSTSFVTDIYRPLINRAASERHYLIVSRAGVAAFGLILMAIALACQPVRTILWFAFQVVSVTGGSLLGIFLFGILTKPAAGSRQPATSNSLPNIMAMTISAICMAVLLILSEYKVVPIAWSWLIVIGTILTFSLAWLLKKV
jgi:SSS family solute:Na+ symporter